MLKSPERVKSDKALRKELANKMKKINNFIVRAFLLLSGLSFLFPLYWMIMMSFKEKSEVYDNPFGLPQVWDMQNYSEALDGFNFLHYLKNSGIYTVSTIAIVLFFGAMLAYALTRMNWKFSKPVTLYLTLGLIIPAQVVIIPLYILLADLNLTGTHFSLILPYSAFALASCVLMLSAFLRTLPKELEEAAAIDGCTVYGTFFKIILPIVRPAIATQAVLISMNTWNEFFLAFIIGAREDIRSLPVALLSFFTSIGVADWGQIGAVMILSSIPTVLIYIFGNKQIENALTAGAVLK